MIKNNISDLFKIYMSDSIHTKGGCEIGKNVKILFMYKIIILNFQQRTRTLKHDSLTKNRNCVTKFNNEQYRVIINVSYIVAASDLCYICRLL
jgi:hypothetical protein